jgi:capsular polysaccharide biosynthesis protein
MDNNYEQDYQDVLKEILMALKEKILLIVAITVLSAVLGWIVSATIIPTKYEASVNMIVNTRTDANAALTNDNISSAQNLVDTYAIIIKSNTILNRVIEDLELDLTYRELYEMVTVDSIRNTQVMKIAVQSDSPETSRQIVVSMCIIAPTVVADAVEAGSCKVVSDVYVEEEPVSPNTMKNVLIASFLGLMACLAVLVLKALTDDSIVDDADVEKKLGLPVLAMIPNMEDKANV